MGLKRRRVLANGAGAARTSGRGGGQRRERGEALRLRGLGQRRRGRGSGSLVRLDHMHQLSHGPPLLTDSRCRQPAGPGRMLLGSTRGSSGFGCRG
jgi:hypothetical protein